MIFLMKKKGKEIMIYIFNIIFYISYIYVIHIEVKIFVIRILKYFFIIYNKYNRSILILLMVFQNTNFKYIFKILYLLFCMIRILIKFNTSHNDYSFNHYRKFFLD